MAKYVIFINVDRSTAIDDGVAGFIWDVREFVGSDSGGSPAEKSGPSLVQGTAPSLEEAKTEAEGWARLFAQETAYVFNTTA